MYRHTGFMLLFCISLHARDVRADQWSQFRGATGNGISAETALPRNWSEDSGLLWKTPLKGRGNSSPAVTSRRVDITTQRDDTSLWVLSFDRNSGRLVHEVRVGEGKLAAAGPANLYAHRHNAATPTPVADDRNIWAFFGTGLLVCVDAESGSVRWRRDLVHDFGAYDITFGMGSSPRLWNNTLYINCMTKGASYVAAIDGDSGRDVWKTPREFDAPDDGPDAYTTPAVVTLGGKPSLLVAGADHVNSYDLKSGRQIWSAGGLGVESPYGRIIASPVASGSNVVATTANPGGGPGRIVAFQIQASSNPNQIWTYDKSTPDSSTPIIVGDHLFMLADSGIMSCLTLSNGQLVWRERLGDGPYHASLIAGAGTVYAIGISGKCSLVTANGSRNAITSNQLSGTFYATPAVSNGILFLRSYESLYAIRGDGI